MKRKKSDRMTGADYLLMFSQAALDSERPYAWKFQEMIYSAFGPDPEVPLFGDLIAKRGLVEYEAAPVAIILAAHEHALANRDTESAQEIPRVGLALLAKWSEYLIAVSAHPRLEFKAGGCYRSENSEG